MLSNRCKEILHELLTRENFVTVNEISDKIGVSSRTVLRTMDEVSDWFDEHDVEFQKKKGTGLRVFADQAKKQELLNELYDEKADLVYSPEERRVIIKAKLLSEQEPIKLFSLSRIFDVTESTVSNDLLYVEPWVESFSLELVKRQGLGIYIKGDEMHIRKAIVALIYEHFQIQGLLSIIMESKNESDSYLEIEKKLDSYVLNLMDVEAIDEIHGLLAEIEKHLGYRFADQGYVALLIRMSLTIKRASGRIKDFNENDSIYKCMWNYIKKEGNHLKDLSDFEIFDLVRFVKGTKYANQSNKRISMAKDFKTVQLVKQLILEMEKNTGIYMSENAKLLTGLVRHLGPAMYRMKNGLDIINPLMEEIKNTYPKLFKATRMSVHIIEEKEKVHVPDDEIAYLATHFGAVIRKSDRDKIKKYQVAVACTYGIGASQLLLNSIERAFENVNIVEVVSVFDKGFHNLDTSDVDLIITTVPIANSKIPTVVIHPIMKDQDILDIRKALDNIQPSIQKIKQMKSIPLKDKLMKLNKYSNVMLMILDNFSTEKVRAKNLEQVIDIASAMLTRSDEEEKRLQEAFVEREEKGSTILGKKGVMLLHCRADIKQNTCIKVIQLEKPILVDEDKTTITSVVIMVAPLAFDATILEVMSAVSRSIISGDFLDRILYGNKEEMYQNLSYVLDQYMKELANE